MPFIPISTVWLPILFSRYQAAACCLGQTTRGLEGSGASTSNCIVWRLHLRFSSTFIFLAPFLHFFQSTTSFLLFRIVVCICFGHSSHAIQPMIAHVVLPRFCFAVASRRVVWQQVKHEPTPPARHSSVAMSAPGC